MSVGLHDAQEDRGAVWRFVAITFLRARFRALSVPLLMAIGLVGCATVTPPVLEAQGSKQAAVVPTGPDYATVAAVRPIRVFAAAADDPQAAILAAMNGSDSAAAPGSASSEIIVRTDNGETLSVVQPDSSRLTPGERVMIVPGGLPRLVPVLPPR